MAWGRASNPFASKKKEDGPGPEQSCQTSSWGDTQIADSIVTPTRNNSIQLATSGKRRGSLASIIRTASISIHSCVEHGRRISWRGCLAMSAGILQQMLCWGMIMTFGTILAYYTDYLLPATPKYQLTLVGTIPPFLLLALALLWGRLLDAGHHRILNIIAAICLVGGLAGLAFTGGNDGDQVGDGKYWAILLAAIPMGVGQSIYFLAAPHMAKTWFPNNKGLAMGITNSGAALGGVAWPFVFTSLTGAIDFRLGVGALAAISLIMSSFIAWAATPAPAFNPRSLGRIRKVSTWIPTKAFRSQTFLVHIAAMCSIYLGILTIPFLIEIWAQKRHLGIPEDIDENGKPVHFDGNDDLTVYIVVAMNACQLPGRLLGSTVCDYVKARKIHAVACIIAIIEIALSWNLATNYVGANNFASFFGLILGIMVSLPINDVQEILGSRRTHLLGQYAGTVYTCASPFILTGGIVSGALVDRYHIRSAGIWACATFGLGFILIMTSLMIKDDTWKFDESSSPETKTDVRKVALSVDTDWEEAETRHPSSRPQSPLKAELEKAERHCPDRTRSQSLDVAMMQSHY